MIDGAKENLANEVVEADEAYLANEADMADKPDGVFVINKPAEAKKPRPTKPMKPRPMKLTPRLMLPMS